jgi:hypothetical protein
MAKVSKKYPKTTGVSAEGSCGHSYSSRISISAYAGTKCTKAKDIQVRNSKRAQIKFMNRSLCKTCEANIIFANITPAADGIFQALGFPALPEITGSHSQKAWAEKIRYGYISSLIYWIVSSVPSQSNLEYFDSVKIDTYNSEELELEISNFTNILNNLEDSGGYLRHTLERELSQGDPQIKLRRLLVMRFVFSRNLNMLFDDRHTVWIMREKRGQSSIPMLANFNNISPGAFLSLSRVVNFSLKNVAEYEKVVEILSQQVLDKDKSIIDSLPNHSDALEKLDMLQVYHSLSPKEEMPF